MTHRLRACPISCGRRGCIAVDTSGARNCCDEVRFVLNAPVKVYEALSLLACGAQGFVSLFLPNYASCMSSVPSTIGKHHHQQQHSIVCSLWFSRLEPYDAMAQSSHSLNSAPCSTSPGLNDRLPTRSIRSPQPSRPQQSARSHSFSQEQIQLFGEQV